MRQPGPSEDASFTDGTSAPPSPEATARGRGWFGWGGGGRGRSESQSYGRGYSASASTVGSADDGLSPRRYARAGGLHSILETIIWILALVIVAACAVGGTLLLSGAVDAADAIRAVAPADLLAAAAGTPAAGVASPAAAAAAERALNAASSRVDACTAELRALQAHRSTLLDEKAQLKAAAAALQATVEAGAGMGVLDFASTCFWLLLGVALGVALARHAPEACGLAKAAPDAAPTTPVEPERQTSTVATSPLRRPPVTQFGSPGSPLWTRDALQGSFGNHEATSFYPSVGSFVKNVRSFAERGTSPGVRRGSRTPSPVPAPAEANRSCTSEATAGDATPLAPLASPTAAFGRRGPGFATAMSLRAQVPGSPGGAGNGSTPSAAAAPTPQRTEAALDETHTSPYPKLRTVGGEPEALELSPHLSPRVGRGGAAVPSAGLPPRFGIGDFVEAWVAGEWRACRIVAMAAPRDGEHTDDIDVGDADALVALGPPVAEVEDPSDIPEPPVNAASSVQAWVAPQLLRRVRFVRADPPTGHDDSNNRWRGSVPRAPPERTQASYGVGRGTGPGSPARDAHPAGAPLACGCAVEVYLHGEAMWVPGEVVTYHDAPDEYVVRLAESRLPETAAACDVRQVLPRTACPPGPTGSVARGRGQCGAHDIPRLPLALVPAYHEASASPARGVGATATARGGGAAGTPANLRFEVGETAEVFMGDALSRDVDEDAHAAATDPASTPWQVCRIVTLPIAQAIVTARSPRPGDPHPLLSPGHSARTGANSVRYHTVAAVADGAASVDPGVGAADGVTLLTIGSLSRVALAEDELGVWLPDQKRAAVVKDHRVRKLRLAVVEVEKKVVVEKVVVSPPAGVGCADCGMLRRNLAHAVDKLETAKANQRVELARLRDQLQGVEDLHDRRRADYRRAEGLFSLESTALEADVLCERALREEAEARCADYEATLRASEAATAAAAAKFLSALHARG